MLVHSPSFFLYSMVFACDWSSPSIAQLIAPSLNISNVSLNSLNYIFSKLFKDTDVKILHVNTMTLRFLVVGEFSEAQKGAVQNIDWLPAGVGLQYYHVITPTFGFKGSGLETFNNGTFATYEIVDL